MFLNLLASRSFRNHLVDLSTLVSVVVVVFCFFVRLSVCKPGQRVWSVHDVMSAKMHVWVGCYSRILNQDAVKMSQTSLTL